jgi:hypothetical protein
VCLPTTATVCRQWNQGLDCPPDTCAPAVARLTTSHPPSPPACLSPDSCIISWQAGCRELRAALDHAGQLLADPATTDVTINIAPAITKITLASSLTLPTLAGSAPLTVAGPGGGAARPVIAFPANSARTVTRPAGAGTATRIAFQDLDFEEVFFIATGPGELRFTDAALAPAAGSTVVATAFTLSDSPAGSRPRLVLTRAEIKGFKGPAGGAINANPADIVATGARPGMISAAELDPCCR